MPKQKTHTGAKKRFKLKKSGIIKRNKMNRRHLLNAKSAKRKVHLRKATTVDKTMESTVRKMLPYGTK